MLFIFLAGCAGGDEETPPTEGEKAAEKKSLTPGETVEKFLEAFEDDRAGVVDAGEHMTREARKFFLALAEKEGKGGFPSVISFRVGKECIKGDTATVEISGRFKRAGKETDREETYMLKKEEDAWKIYKVVGEGEEFDFENAPLEGDH
ncbi:MAG: hypothetical protein ACYTFG_22780 [Planctomycetota bacterium]